jgi:hypothetical protein
MAAKIILSSGVEIIDRSITYYSSFAGFSAFSNPCKTPLPASKTGIVPLVGI